MPVLADKHFCDKDCQGKWNGVSGQQTRTIVGLMKTTKSV